ncbi:DUF3179 domain-containing (seleno)protein [Natronomonas sp. EA1]|uniref:DUF3179 domain-containing (seleno)protein n=1 Tax=Natronomonas sp. EA1 TaxID=3421655 RepID=UPI003EBFCC22
MKRRRYLVSLGAVAPLAGCAGYQGASTPTPDSTSIAEQGFPATVCEEPLLPELIRAIASPSFASGGELDPDERLVVVESGGVTRGYPRSILRVHEAVNAPDGLLVTFCPLCNSGVVASRVVEGEEATFGVSGQLWKPPDAYTAARVADGDAFAVGEGDVRDTGNLVLYDLNTESRWSQLLARAICGPLDGTRLDLHPSTVVTWAEWQAEYDGVVLQPPSEAELL